MTNLPDENQNKTSSKIQKYWQHYEMNSKEIYELIDQRIYREHNLISNRMTWYVTSQSFLMAAFAVSGGQGNSVSRLFKLILPILGMLISLIILASIIAAWKAMQKLGNYRREILKADGYLQRIEPFKSRFMDGKYSWINYLGVSPPILMPLLFLIAWILILAAFLRSIL